MAAFKSGGWDGRSSFFDYGTASFPAGFVHAVSAVLKEDGHTVQIVRKPLPAPLGVPKPVVDDFGDNPLYDYQPKTVDALLRYGMMVAQVATGGGKSRIARLAYARIARPTLFLTTRSVLMYQMKDSFEENLKLRAGVIGEGVWAPRKGFNVAMVQTLIAALKDPARRELVIKFLQYVEFVILEEAHEAGGNGYYEILQLCKNAHYRLSLTATPFMRDDGESNMRLMAVSGPVGIRITERFLIERGILAKPYFKYISTPKPAKLFKSSSWRKAYAVGIVENAHRNAEIIREALRAVHHGLPVMILVQHTRHGTLLKEGIQRNSTGVAVEYIHGKHEQDQRKAALSRLGSGKTNILIGSTILDVGVDVPSVGMVILAGGGKAEVALRQRIGRGLRAKKTGANVAYIVDFKDEHNNYLVNHAKQRRMIVEATPGFGENILLDNQDFDYRGHGFAVIGSATK